MNPNSKEGGQASAFSYSPDNQKQVPKPMKLGSGGSSDVATPFTYTSRQTDLKTTDGLYDLANKAGLGNEADKMIQRSGGESQKFMSGGFIMDAMDILNAASYGVVGLVKGKGFMEGIKNRESLSDDDALGKYGWQGKIAGFIGDILLDPLTYIAPIKIISKIPGVAKAFEAGTEKVFGKLVEREVTGQVAQEASSVATHGATGATAQEAGSVVAHEASDATSGLRSATDGKMKAELETITVPGQKTFKREGGWKPMVFLADKLVYGFAASKEFLSGVQRTAGKNEALLADGEKLVSTISKLKPGLFDRTLSKAADGRMISKPLNELEIELKREGLDEDFNLVKEMYAFRDSLMQRLVDLGVVTEETKDAHWGTYLKQSYDEFLDAKNSLKGTKSGAGIVSKSRVAELTPEKMAELGQVKDGAVLWATTLIKQIDLIKKAEIQNFVAKGYAMTHDMIPEFIQKGGRTEDLHFVEDSPKYRLGEIDIKKDLASVNKEFKSVLKERRVALRDDKNLTATLNKIEAEMERLRGSTEDDIGEALSGLKEIIRDQSTTKLGGLKKVPTSEGQKMVAKPLKEWLTRGGKKETLARETISTKDLWKEYKNTPGGIALENSFQDPRLMYQWRSPEEFIDAIRYPDRKIIYSEATKRTEDLTDAQSLARIKRAEANARRFGELEQTKKVLSETNLTLVRDAVDRLEQKYADILWKKSGILEAMETNRMGQLAGKFVSKEVWNTIKGTYEPSKELGENLVLGFKHIKVVWNPASHVRNAMSAAIQNWWKLGMGPWRMDLYYAANKEFKTGSKDLDDMRELGFSERSGFFTELMNNYLTNEELVKSTINHQLGGSGFKRYAKKLDRLMLNSYGHTDNIAKLAGYKHGLSKGLTKEEAYAQAMAATFNYSEITPFVHQMRRAIWGVPFITFALKAAPLVAETLAKNPHRISVFGKARNDLFKAAGIEGQQESEAMPAYMRDDMFVMRLPWKDGNGRSMYFDLSYIIPFGSLADGSLLKDPASANPVLQLVRELSQNETFSGKKIFKESDDVEDVLADISVHVMKLGLPPPVTDFLSDGYNNNGERAQSKMGWERAAGINTNDMGSGERTYYQNAFKALGLSATPYELNSKEAALEYTQRENLTKLLTEHGVLKTFSKPYLPSDSEFNPKNEHKPIYDRDTRPLGR